MKLIDVILISLYFHFTKMKDKGRQVVPWFSTCVAVSFFLAISGTLILKLILDKHLNDKNVAEITFLMVFMAFGILCFFVTKGYFFNSGKYMEIAEIYDNTYSAQQKLLYKIFSISILLIIPFVLGFAVWWVAKPI